MASTSSSPPQSSIGSPESDPNQVYCICRKKDDGTPMVECDGCKEWYHLHCIGLPKRAAPLIHKYFCVHNACRSDTNQNRNYLRCGVEGCWNPARRELGQDNPDWKYCSDECRAIFWKELVSKFRNDKSPSHGGVLNKNELMALVNLSAGSSEHLRRMCLSPKLNFHAWNFTQLTVSPSLQELKSLSASVDEATKPKIGMGGIEADGFQAFDFDVLLNEEEVEIIKDLTKQMRTHFETRAFSIERASLLPLVSKRNEMLLEALAKIDGRSSVCGYDEILCEIPKKQVEFLRSEAGKKALKNGYLEVPVLSKIVAKQEEIFNEDGQSLCIKTRKACKAHNYLEAWQVVWKDNFEWATARAENARAKCEFRIVKIRQHSIKRAAMDQAAGRI